MRGTAGQSIDHTRSRRTGPRKWLRAVVWLIGAGLHPKANDTTLAVAEDLAARMDYSSGHVRYGMDAMAARLGISRAGVKRHVGYLRELGALAWVQHGTRINIRRTLGLTGYAATATVYAAVIPPVYDRAMGHRVVGAGYSARIVIDQRGRARIPAQRTPEPVDNCPVDNSGSAVLEPPSLTGLRRVGQVQVVGGEETSTAKAAASRITLRKKRRLTVTGYRITPARIEAARRLARTVRPLVNWVQGASLDELSWVLLDMVARDWSEPKIVLWLNQLGARLGVRRWRPDAPHRVIAAALKRQDEADTATAHGHTPAVEESVPSGREEWRQACAGVRRHRETVVDYPLLEEAAECVEERVLLREQAGGDLGLVRSFVQLAGRDAAVRVYGLTAVAALDAAIEQERAGFAGAFA